MIIDGANLFDTAAALTATRVSTNVIDLGIARDLGIGDNRLKLFAMLTSALLSGGASTLNVQIQGSTDNSTYTTMAETGAIAKAQLIAGVRLFDTSIPRPVPGQARPRYLQLRYEVAVSDFTAGAVTAALVFDRDDNVYYPSGIAVSN